MRVFLLVSLLFTSQVFACKMTPLGSTKRSIAAVLDYAANNETQESAIRAVYQGETSYVYEVKRQSKCIATAVKVEVGPDCNHTVIKLDDKINCRLN